MTLTKNIPVTVVTNEVTATEDRVLEILELPTVEIILNPSTGWGRLEKRVALFEKFGIFCCVVDRAGYKKLKRKVATGMIKAVVDSRVTTLEDIEYQFRESNLIGTEKFMAQVPWNIESLGLSPFHSATSGNGVKVAVIDSGVSSQNLSGGCYFVGSDYFDTHQSGHGTRCASIIKTPTDNPKYEGIASGCELYSVKVVNPISETSLHQIIGGLYYCLTENIDIISCSIGSRKGDVSVFDRACEVLLDNDCLCIAAVGNEGNETLFATARSEFTIGVGGHNQAKRFWEGGLYDPNERNPKKNVELLAPAEKIQTLNRYKKWVESEGTSMAAPQIAGVAAILKAADPSRTARDIRSLINQGCTPNRDDTKMQGYGVFSMAQIPTL